MLGEATCAAGVEREQCVLHILGAREATGACGVNVNQEQNPLFLQCLSFALY